MTTLHRRLLWISRAAGLDDAWAYRTHVAIAGAEPIITKRTPLKPTKEVIKEASHYLNAYHRSRVEYAYANASVSRREKRLRRDIWLVVP